MEKFNIQFVGNIEIKVWHQLNYYKRIVKYWEGKGPLEKILNEITLNQEDDAEVGV